MAYIPRFLLKDFWKISDNVEPEVIIKRSTGRPKGSTNIRKHHLKEVVLAAKNEITKFYLEENDEYKKKERDYHRNGSMKKL